MRHYASSTSTRTGVKSSSTPQPGSSSASSSNKTFANTNRGGGFPQAYESRDQTATQQKKPQQQRPNSAQQISPRGSFSSQDGIKPSASASSLQQYSHIKQGFTVNTTSSNNSKTRATPSPSSASASFGGGMNYRSSSSSTSSVNSGSGSGGGGGGRFSPSSTFSTSSSSNNKNSAIHARAAMDEFSQPTAAQMNRNATASVLVERLRNIVSNHEDRVDQKRSSCVKTGNNSNPNAAAAAAGFRNVQQMSLERQQQQQRQGGEESSSRGGTPRDSVEAFYSEVDRASEKMMNHYGVPTGAPPSAQERQHQQQQQQQQRKKNNHSKNNNLSAAASQQHQLQEKEERSVSPSTKSRIQRGEDIITYDESDDDDYYDEEYDEEEEEEEDEDGDNENNTSTRHTPSKPLTALSQQQSNRATPNRIMMMGGSSSPSSSSPTYSPGGTRMIPGFSQFPDWSKKSIGRPHEVTFNEQNRVAMEATNHVEPRNLDTWSKVQADGNKASFLCRRCGLPCFPASCLVNIARAGHISFTHRFVRTTEPDLCPQEGTIVVRCVRCNGFLGDLYDVQSRNIPPVIRVSNWCVWYDSEAVVPKEYGKKIGPYIDDDQTAEDEEKKNPILPSPVKQQMTTKEADAVLDTLLDGIM